MNDEPWRDPTTAERALLAVLSQADVPEREILAAQLATVSVRSSCGCGCGSIELRPASRVALLDPGARGYAVDSQGTDELGRLALVAIVAREGLVIELDISPAATDGILPPAPETLFQLDAVPRGTLALNWMVPRTRTILEEAAARSG